MRGSWRPNRTAIYWLLLSWPSALCLSRSPGLLNRRPGGPLCWLSLLHLITKWSGPQTPSGVPRAPSVGCGFSYHISSLTRLAPTRWLPVYTELYNSSIAHSISLEWHVWSSSSGNICHAVHRSHSSGASVYECTMGIFTLSHFFSQAHLRDFLS